MQSSLSERELFRNIMQSPYQSPIGVLAGFITFVYLKYKQIKSIINNFSTLTKLCTLLRTGRTKTIPYPVTHPRLGHIREFPLPPFSEALSDQTTPLITTVSSQRPFLSLQNKIIYSIEHKAVQRVQSSLSERELFRNIMQSPYQSPIGVLAGFITFVYFKYKQINNQ